MRATEFLVEDRLDEGFREVAIGTLLGMSVAASGFGMKAAYDAFNAETQKPAQTQAAEIKTAPVQKPTDIKQNLIRHFQDTMDANAAKHAIYLAQKAASSGIVGAELVAFLAHAAHETHNFKSLSEYTGGNDQYFKRYEPKFAKDRKTKKTIVDPKTGEPKNFNSKASILGNKQVGDGERFKGRGYLMNTGRWNYEQLSKNLGVDLVKNPDLLLKPEVAADAAIWHWNNRVKTRSTDTTKVETTLKAINSGMSGLEDRQNKYDSFMAAARGQQQFAKPATPMATPTVAKPAAKPATPKTKVQQTSVNKHSTSAKPTPTDAKKQVTKPPVQSPKRK